MDEPKRKVAKFATNFLDYSQTFIYDEIRFHRRYEVEVFCHRRMNEATFPCDRVHALAPAETLGQSLEGLLYQATTLSPTVYRALKAGNFDVIHAHFGPGGIYALPYRKALGTPLVVSFHGYDVPLLLSSRRFHPQWLRYFLLSPWMLKSVDRFLPSSMELKRLLIQLGAPAHKVKLHHVGVEIPAKRPRLRNRVGEVNIYMIGRFIEKTGMEYGLEAFARVLSQGAPVRMRIIGGGENKELYQGIVRRHDMMGRVEFLGDLEHTVIMRELANCDILLTPSVVAANGDREGQPAILKEANARCIPAVGTIHSGIPELIEDGVTGLLVSEKDVDTMAQKLMVLVDNPELRRTMGLAAREKMVREQDVERRVEALEQHLDEVVEQWRRNHPRQP